MGLFDGCLIACDIDGTLMHDGEINPVNIEKIGFFVKEGGRFSLSTGRSVLAFNMVLRALGDLVSPSIVANGGMIFDYKNDKILYETYLPKSDYKIVEKILSLNIDTGIEVHSGKNVFDLKQSEETKIHQQYEEIAATPLSFKQAEAHAWNKVLFAGNPQGMAAVRKLCEGGNYKSRFVDTSAVICNRSYSYYEQVPNGVSKATALHKLCNILDIRIENCYAIGDYYNDLEVLKIAAVSAAPVESPDDIKAAADYITATAEQGAVADFIDFLTQMRGCKK